MHSAYLFILLHTYKPQRWSVSWGGGCIEVEKRERLRLSSNEQINYYASMYVCIVVQKIKGKENICQKLYFFLAQVKVYSYAIMDRYKLIYMYTYTQTEQNLLNLKILRNAKLSQHSINSLVTNK